MLETSAYMMLRIYHGNNFNPGAAITARYILEGAHEVYLFRNNFFEHILWQY